MLNVRQRDMAGALGDLWRFGVGKLSGALTPEAQQDLSAAIDRMGLQHASEREGEVSQDFDLLVVKLPLKGRFSRPERRHHRHRPRCPRPPRTQCRPSPTDSPPPATT